MKLLAKKEIIFFDGAIGTEISRIFPQKNFSIGEILNLENPEKIEKIHQNYLAAGADIITTNSFSGNSRVLSEFKLEKKMGEINFAAAKIAKKTTKKWEKKTGQKKFVAGSIGPGNEMLFLGHGNFENFANDFEKQAENLWRGGVDFLVLETFSDILVVKAAMIGIKNLEKKLQQKIPFFLSVTLENNGKMISGHDIFAAAEIAMPFFPVCFGINCGFGPEKIFPNIEKISSQIPVFCSTWPNAGLPDENGNYSQNPKKFAKNFQPFFEKKLLNFAGGCCGTRPEHIFELKKNFSNNFFPRQIPKILPSFFAVGISKLSSQKSKSVLVGERTNCIGSKIFRKLITEENFEIAAEIAREQVLAGSQILDVCLANPNRNEKKDATKFLDAILKFIKIPIMIDSENPEVIASLLPKIPGKPIINSINLEKLEKFLDIAEQAKKFGAVVVVGAIDEKGMGTCCKRKIEILKKAEKILREKLNFSPQNIIFDPLVFPLGSGEKNLKNTAKETFAALKILKKQFKFSPTILGVSNCSFGFPAKSRPILNSVFTHLATKNGLDLAIVNPQNFLPISKISTVEKKLAEDLILEKNNHTAKKFVDFFRKKTEEKTEFSAKKTKKSLEKILGQNLISGKKSDLEKILEKILEKKSAQKILEKILLPAMDQVGKKFGNGDMIIAEVLQSAEIMKKATDFLRPRFNLSEKISQKKLLLATVAGDVHDIGKNLVKIIFENSGIEVLDLGTKISAEKIFKAAKNFQPDAIGLSGLLVRSAEEMIRVAEFLKSKKITIPILVGGAALNKNFVNEKIAPKYFPKKVFFAREVMEGLKIFRENIANKEKNKNNSNESYISKTEKTKNFKDKNKFSVTEKSEKIIQFEQEKILQSINLDLLFGRHFGVKNFSKNISSKNCSEKIKNIFQEFKKISQKIITKKYFVPRGIFEIFFTESKNKNNWQYETSQNKIKFSLLSENLKYEMKFPEKNNISAANFANKKMAIFVISAGKEILDFANNLEKKGEFLLAQLCRAIAIESSEIIANEMQIFLEKLVKNKAVRISPGYPSADLKLQKKIFAILKPQRIGIELTKNLMMSPECSISAFVFLT